MQEAENKDVALEAAWRVELGSFNPLMVQTLTLPDKEVETDSISDGAIDYKHPTRLKTGNLVLGRVLNRAAADFTTADWINRIVNADTGVVAAKSDIAVDGSVIRLDGPNGKEIARYKLRGVFPTKVSGLKFDKKSGKILMEEATFSVDSMMEVPVTQ